MTRRACVRRLTSDAVHYVDDPPTFQGEVFLVPCEEVVLPVVTLCGSVLKGRAVVMEPCYRPSTKRPETDRPIPVCSRCRNVASRTPDVEVSWPRHEAARRP